MNLTIVKADNLVIVDDQPQQVDLSTFNLPNYFWALQWRDDHGEIEFNNHELNESIAKLPDWAIAIVAEYHRFSEEQNQQLVKDEQKAVFIANGMAREERIKRENEQQASEEFLKLKQQASEEFLKLKQQVAELAA